MAVGRAFLMWHFLIWHFLTWQDGVVQCWDPRTRAHLGSCSPFDAPGVEPVDAAAPKEVTALRFDARGLQVIR